ncbi:hypothetical protein [Clostridium felsineum]|uniref:Uncharacterized protein n=1 Tax=Clostridium felsineum TaxID=36839 RepID=A0A1S8MGM0_9CLOT|nr:hypothetical protein [Clostridium felsineum]URZ07801.1 hypothetical protein CLROS_031620 [Clostridium felsineum]URZ12832.1 hypothetical protein CROST_035770 [Clostridium felsineum]
MIRFQKRVAIFFYTISIATIGFDILYTIRCGIDFSLIMGSMLFIVLYIPAAHINKWHKNQIERYTKLLKADKVDRIEYMIDHIDTVRGVAYNIVFYINGEMCELRIPAYKCKKNNNYEYYLEPIYKKNGKFKDFIVYVDKKSAYDKSAQYLNEIREYEEKLSEARRQKNKDK